MQKQVLDVEAWFIRERRSNVNLRQDGILHAFVLDMLERIVYCMQTNSKRLRYESRHAYSIATQRVHVLACIASFASNFHVSIGVLSQHSTVCCLLCEVG